VALAAAAISRLAHPNTVNPGPVILVAAIAMVVNIGLAGMLSRAGRELGVRSALLHLMADAVAAAGVLVSGVIILTTGWQAADPAMSLLIAVLIAAGALRLLREARQILGEATPWGIDAERVRNAILTVGGVEGVHDLHIWSLDRSHRALSAHITVADRPLGEITALLHAVETRLCSEYGIEHATLQPECPACVVDPTLFCDLDERHVLVHDRATGVGSTLG
jgi:cobalt-zinc-cadmium efflux system protein